VPLLADGEIWGIDRVDDSIARLASLPDKCVDVVITDPPFSEHVHANMCSGTVLRKQKEGKLPRGVPKYESAFASFGDAQNAWIKDAIRVAKRWVVVHCGVEDFGKFELLVGRPEYVRGCIWHKRNSIGQLTADRPATAYEGITLFHAADVKKRWNGRGSYGIWTCNGTRGKKDRHPNEKPLDLCLKLVSLFSERGEIILDPFAGSAAIGEAAVRLGRMYSGWDNDANWVMRAGVRLSAAGGMEPVTDEHALSLCRFDRTPAAYK
jgi:site-specific DNA-methyltransferase (adenine-specific)